MSERVFLGLGANVGNRQANLLMALRLLAPGCRVVAVSSLYESPALVPDGGPPGPDFLNAVCEIATRLGAEELMLYIKQIEWDIGRRPTPRWSPRPIDVDLLLYGDRYIDMETITVPHPRMCERAFVVVPLTEIAPDVVHPRIGRTFAELASEVDRTGLKRAVGPEWALERGSLQQN